MMKNKTIILLFLLLLSVLGNIYMFSKVKKFKEVDVKQEKIFTEVSDSLTYFRMQRDSIAHRQ